MYLLGYSPICYKSCADLCRYGQGAGMNITLDNPASTNDLDYPTGQRGGKAFATLSARFALLGYQLTRTDPLDGPVNYHAARYGLVRCLPAQCDAQRLITHMEAKP
jgi:hypothetical protein